MNRTELSMRHTLVPFLGAVLALALAGCPAEPLPPEPLPAAPEILDFRASAEVVDAGATINLGWETKNAVSVELFDATRGAVSGADALSGTVDVTVNEATLFVLVAKNARGLRESRVVSVRVNEASREVLFFAAPQIVDAGGNATLAWSSPAARTVSLRVQGGEALDIGEQKASGSIAVQPERDTTYELLVDGVAHTATVRTRPTVALFTSAPTSMTAGEPLTLKWETRGATAVVVSRPGHGTVHTATNAEEVAAGEVTVNIPETLDPAAAFTWHLTALGTAAEVVTTTELTVYVAGQPRIVTSSAPRYARLGDTFTLAWTTKEADRVRVLADGAPIYESPDRAKAANHSLQFPTPEIEVTYTLLAINDRGGQVTRTHKVAPVGITHFNSFSVSPAQISQGGDPVTLTWSVDEARRVRIVANGTRTVFSTSGTGAVGGTVTVYPNENTTYELFADNLLGDEVDATGAVVVDAEALMTASPTGPVALNTPLDLSWTAGGATSEIWGMPHGDMVTRLPSTGFIDISETGTELPFAPNADDAVLPFDPQFDTFFWGQPAPSRVFVSTNGFLVFGNSSQTRSAVHAIPNSVVEKFFVAPLWADLEFKPGAKIYWEVVGEAPERELVVQWDGLRVFDGIGTEVTFQARIHQTGMIHFEYQTVDLGPASPVIGVQGPTPSQGLQFFPSLQPGLGITLFGPKAAPVAYGAVSSEPTGGFVKIGDAYLKLRFTPAVILPGLLRLSEVMYRPVAPLAATGEWVEIFNTTSASYDLDGFELDFGNGQTHTLSSANGNTVVPANGYLLLGQSADPLENDGVNVGYVYGPTFQLDDNGGTLSLNRGGPVASITWSTAAGGVGVSAQADASAALYAGGGTGGSICSSTAPFGTQNPQQLGTPGGSGACYPYSMSSIPGAFEDVSGTGTIVSLSSDYTGIAQVNLPAPFTYFGVTYNSFSVTICGIMTMGYTLTAAHDTAQDVLPSPNAPNGTLAIFWDRIVRNTNGEIYVQRRSNYTIVSWQDFRIYAQGGNQVNFQIKLFDNGVIEYHYGNMNPGTYAPDRTRGSAATVWLEKEDGSSALPYSIRQNGGVQPNSGVRFTPL